MKCVSDDYTNRVTAFGYIDSFAHRRNDYTCLRRINIKYIKNPKVIGKRMKDPLIKVLINICHTTHPFIIQCAIQGCCNHFIIEDDLKKHMLNEHQYTHEMAINYEIYTISQLFNENNKCISHLIF
jgi:hypothetical protein